jgi:molybdenum cofactor cytidylyltransferase
MNDQRLFAIIPATGLSLRMGVPKLLMPWNGKTMIENLIDSLNQAGIFEIIVTVRSDNQKLQKVLNGLSVIPVIPELHPGDMKASVQNGLEFIQNQFHPTEDDGWLLTPADFPMISTETVSKLVSHWKQSDADIIIPTYQNRNGHPVLFKWELAKSVFEIPENKGINWVVGNPKWNIDKIPVEDSGIVQDIDTQEDYRKFQSPDSDG